MAQFRQQRKCFHRPGCGRRGDYKKSYGKESKLAFLDHALVEDRNGLIAAAMATHADGYAERDAALLRLKEKQEGRSHRITEGADRASDTRISSARRVS